METIIISNLEVFYHVGVTDEERAKAQRLLLTLELELNFSKAIANDDLAATVDYAAVSRRLLTFGNGRQWQLIEKLAADIAALILDEFKPRAVTVEVRKFVIPEAAHVAVRLTRRRE